jgi:DNA-binding CsgD family transcriptional regulator
MVPDLRLASLIPDLLPEIERGTPRPSDPSSAGERREPSGSTDEELSGREREVLRYLPTMLTTREIAAELFVSVNTVKAHMRSIYRKLGASRRHAAVIRAYEYGILRPRSFVRPSADADLRFGNREPPSASLANAAGRQDRARPVPGAA